MVVLMTALQSFCEAILSVLLSVVSFLSAWLISFYILSLMYMSRSTSLLRKRNSAESDILVAFFHPYCDSGGGGERVLWFAVHALLNKSILLRDKIHVVIYTGDVLRNKYQILLNVKNRFGLAFSETDEKKITFVYIRSRTLLEAKWYPVATMIFQSLGSIVVGVECLLRAQPDLYCDTTGAAFVYPLVKLYSKAKVISYTHYPIISTDMLNAVREQRPSYNNSSRVSSSVSISTVKLLYYRVFAWMYGAFAGAYADVVMVNSTWTRNHIAQLWHFSDSDSDEVSDDSVPVSVSGRAGVVKEQQGARKKGEGKMDTHAAAGQESGESADAGVQGYRRRRLRLVYPPCSTDHLQTIPLTRRLPRATNNTRVRSISDSEKTRGDVSMNSQAKEQERALGRDGGKSNGKSKEIKAVDEFAIDAAKAAMQRRLVVSIGQFRPEKDHSLQLQILKALREKGERFRDVTLVLIGSTRHVEDKQLVRKLQWQARTLGLPSYGGVRTTHRDARVAKGLLQQQQQQLGFSSAISHTTASIDVDAGAGGAVGGAIDGNDDDVGASLRRRRNISGVVNKKSTDKDSGTINSGDISRGDVQNGGKIGGNVGEEGMEIPPVLFVVNQKYDKLVEWMGASLIGLHTMWNEHFGISVVEMMAAGLAVVAHRSGGPLLDIVSTHEDDGVGDRDVVDSTAVRETKKGGVLRTGKVKERFAGKETSVNGFLAESVEEYADTLAYILDRYAADAADAVATSYHDEWEKEECNGRGSRGGEREPSQRRCSTTTTTTSLSSSNISAGEVEEKGEEEYVGSLTSIRRRARESTLVRFSEEAFMAQIVAEFERAVESDDRFSSHRAVQNARALAQLLAGELGRK